MPRSMAYKATSLAGLGLIVAINVFFLTSASAELFGGDGRYSAPTTHEFAAQTSRPRITIYPRQPGRNAQRHCRAWLAKEYRVSGPVIVPRQRCWWQ